MAQDDVKSIDQLNEEADIAADYLEIHRHVTMRLLTVRARLQPLFPNHIVNDFTFEGIHRLQVIRLAGILHCVNGIQGDITEVLTLALQETVDIHNQMRSIGQGQGRGRA